MESRRWAEGRLSGDFSGGGGAGDSGTKRGKDKGKQGQRGRDREECTERCVTRALHERKENGVTEEERGNMGKTKNKKVCVYALPCLPNLLLLLCLGCV